MNTNDANGPEWLQGKLCPRGLVHAFTTRRGGVSQGPFASQNFGRKWGDEPRAVDDNFARLAQRLGYESSALATVEQVHGNEVLRACELGPGSQADALWMHRNDPGPRVVAVRTADCVSLLIASRDGSYVAAVHSGWRGTVKNIVAATVARLLVEGCLASELVAAIGPCIERAAFEVGHEVAEHFDDRFVDRSGAKPHVDLVACVRAQLIDAGVEPAAIERVGGCTHDQPDTYFSYRRDGQPTGQLLSLIGWPKQPG